MVKYKKEEKTFTKEEKYAIGKEGYDNVDTAANLTRKYRTKYINMRNWQKAYAKSIGGSSVKLTNYGKRCKSIAVAFISGRSESITLVKLRLKDQKILRCSLPITRHIQVMVIGG